MYMYLSHRCWISNTDGSIWAFIAPVTLILLVSTIILPTAPISIFVDQHDLVYNVTDKDISVRKKNDKSSEGKIRDSKVCLIILSKMLHQFLNIGYYC